MSIGSAARRAAMVLCAAMLLAVVGLVLVGGMPAIADLASAATGGPSAFAEIVKADGAQDARAAEEVTTGLDLAWAWIAVVLGAIMLAGTWLLVRRGARR